ncbi:hypothetical protein KY285_027873 [Solanum tuberosum]|nr:hypothetical protein KY285_027873 [Solanum tuberosum]
MVMSFIHEVDELEEFPAPTGLLSRSDPVDESVGINTEGTVENDSDLNGVDTELPGDIDEELRSLWAERKNKKNHNLRKRRDRKKKTITEKVPIGETGVDIGFEDIGINKKDRYVGKLGKDEKYIDSSECDSYYSTDMLDAEAVGGVDLPGRRKRKKIKLRPNEAHRVRTKCKFKEKCKWL